MTVHGLTLVVFVRATCGAFHDAFGLGKVCSKFVTHVVMGTWVGRRVLPLPAMRV